MKPGIQTFFAEVGEAACYALDLIDVAQEWHEVHNTLVTIDPCQALQFGIARKRIHYNAEDENDENNFFVEEPAMFLDDLTAHAWEVRKEPPEYEALAKPDEFVILRSERVKTGAVLGHFWRRRFNSLVHSLCVERGKVVSLRVCRPLA